MAKYKFHQFSVEIENPTIHIKTITFSEDESNKVSIVINLTTADTKIRSVALNDIAFTGTWNDVYTNRMSLVEEKLLEFEID